MRRIGRLARIVRGSRACGLQLQRSCRPRPILVVAAVIVFIVMLARPDL
jgi:hypothetical protein